MKTGTITGYIAPKGKILFPGKMRVIELEIADVILRWLRRSIDHERIRSLGNIAISIEFHDLFATDLHALDKMTAFDPRFAARIWQIRPNKDAPHPCQRYPVDVFS